MKKSDIAGRVADRIGLGQSAAGNAVDAVFEAVGEALANGEEVRIAGFGTFGTRNRPARTGRNPQTGESLSIPASTAPAFKPGKAPKDAVSDGKASLTGNRRGSGSSENQGGLDVETGRFRCDDGDPGCPGTTAAKTKQTQWVDGYLSTPRPARWQIRQKHNRSLLLLPQVPVSTAVDKAGNRSTNRVGNLFYRCAVWPGIPRALD